MSVRLALWHKGRDHIAFYTTRRLAPGEAMLARDFVSVDGRPLVAGETLVCGTCGESVDGGSVSYNQPATDTRDALL